MRRRRTWIWAGAAALLLAILLIGFEVARRAGAEVNGGTRVGAGAATSAPAASTRSGPPIKVGLIISLTTARGPNFAGTVQGWQHAAFASQLRDPATELYGVVDPGTQNDAEVLKTVKRYIPGARMVDGGDAAALGKLDVIVASGNSNMDPSVLDAMIEAISHGTGFLCAASTVGGRSPADPVRQDKLHGMDGAEFFYHPKPLQCVIVGDHPLLAGLKRAGVKELTIKTFDGMAGELRGTGLIALVDDSADGGATTTPAVRTDFYPLYVSQLGKGRIVGVQFETIPEALKTASKGRFYVQCAQWLAGRTVE